MNSIAMHDIGDEALSRKFEALKDILRRTDRAIAAFSGGVDSTFLLYVCHEMMGTGVIAVTCRTCGMPACDLDMARDFCRQHAIQHADFEISDLENDSFRRNPPERCYLCKKMIYAQIWKFAEQAHVSVVFEGSNMDDLSDYRPGERALREMHVRSPLREAGLTKKDIRDLSRKLGLSVWNMPSAACLVSRLAYGEEITQKKLSMIEQAESFLRSCGFHQVRVRMHGDLARVEVPPEAISTAADLHAVIADSLKSYGFRYVTLDLLGYRMGSMNEALQDMRQ